MRTYLSLILLGLTLPLVAQQSLWGTFKGSVRQDDEAGVLLKLEELCEIAWPAQADSLQGLDVDIEIPADWQKFRYNYAVMVFHKVTPQPLKGISSYRGQRIFSHPIPPVSKFTVRVPLSTSHNLRGGPNAEVIPLSQGLPRSPLLLTIVPIEKGIPSAALAAQFTIKARPVTGSQAGLRLIIPNVDSNELGGLRISLGGKFYEPGQTIFREAGVFDLEITSPHFETYRQKVTLVAGKVQDLTFNMLELSPTLVVEAPEGTQLILNGKRLAPSETGTTSAQIEKGLHTLTVVLGGYQLSKTFEVTQGGTTRISIGLEISVDTP